MFFNCSDPMERMFYVDMNCYCCLYLLNVRQLIIRATSKFPTWVTLKKKSMITQFAPQICYLSELNTDVHVSHVMCNNALPIHILSQCTYDAMSEQNVLINIPIEVC